MKNSLDIRPRLQRFLQGTRRVDDLDRIFLALRDQSYGRASVREIGDFVAHRQERLKGVVTDKVRDIFTSFESWGRGLSGQIPTLDVAKKAATANMRIVTDEQLNERLGLRREIVKSTLVQGLKKLERDQPDKLTERERRVFNYLASAFIWNPAFTDELVADELAFVLRKMDLLSDADGEAFDAQRPFLALYVVALMHGSAILLENGTRIDLVAGFGNKEGRIEVKALLTLQGLAKPVLAPICVFWTKLAGHDHCVPPLDENPGGWSDPIEIDDDGRLASFS